MTLLCFVSPKPRRTSADSTEFGIGRITSSSLLMLKFKLGTILESSQESIWTRLFSVNYPVFKDQKNTTYRAVFSSWRERSSRHPLQKGGALYSKNLFCQGN